MASFLKELKSLREKKNLPLEEISDKTRINLKFLQQIESGEIDFLPPAYVKAFIKTYAKYVGMNVEVTVREVEELFAPKTPAIKKTEEETIEPEDKKPKTAKKSEPKKPDEPKKIEDTGKLKKETEQPDKKEKTIPTEKKIETPGKSIPVKISESGPVEIEPEKPFSKKKSSRFIPVIVVIIAVVIVFSLQSYFRGKEDSVPIVQSHEVTPVQEEETPVQEAEPEETETTTFSLECRANEITWFRISVDGDSVREYTFYTGNSRIWEARDSIVMRVGKAQGLDFIHNGTELDTLGSKDQLLWYVRFNENGVAQRRFRRRSEE